MLLLIDPVINSYELRALNPHMDGVDAAAWASSLDGARAGGDLTTPLRVRHFMAQCATETGGFSRLSENLHYSEAARLTLIFPHEIYSDDDAEHLIQQGPQAIANRVYANRMGNGDEASGDGWKFRGRGFLQITGRSMYAKIGQMIGMDLTADPDILLSPSGAAKAAALYWKDSGCNAAADANSVSAVTKLINGSLTGLDDRTGWLTRTARLWP